MAEWLRRWTRNPMGFPRAGSNPARSDVCFIRSTTARTFAIFVFSFLLHYYIVLVKIRAFAILYEVMVMQIKLRVVVKYIH